MLTAERATPAQKVREAGILMSADNVIAIYQDLKTQTRRIIDPQPIPNGTWDKVKQEFDCVEDGYPPSAMLWKGGWLNGDAGSPWSKVDRLYVREAWRTPKDLDKKSGTEIATACLDAGYSRPWCPIQYEADGARRNEWRGWGGLRDLQEPEVGRYRHARFMPRWASRITLELVGVRAERLQDISAVDAVAEGCTMNRNGFFWGGPHETGGRKQFATPVRAYEDLWESINGLGSWEANPWVWCVQFVRTKTT